MHAEPVCLGSASKAQPDKRFVCAPCSILVSKVRRGARMDPYELKALDGGVDAVGDYVGEIGKTDLGDYDELEQRMLVKAAWQGSVRRLHEILSNNEAPF